MFTGLIQATGIIHQVQGSASGASLEIHSPASFAKTRVGDSIAVNGCCLTAVSVQRVRKAVRIRFDLLQETWRLTNFQHLAPGQRVNLEPALLAGDRLGGHWVNGHIDGPGVITRWEPHGKDYRLEIAVPKHHMPFLVPKGCVAVDGISLTVADVQRGSFGVWIIPHTCTVTQLSDRRVGDVVNLEFDATAKLVSTMVERYLAAHSRSRPMPRRRKH